MSYAHEPSFLAYAKRSKFWHLSTQSRKALDSFVELPSSHLQFAFETLQSQALLRGTWDMKRSEREIRKTVFCAFFIHC